MSTPDILLLQKQIKEKEKQLRELIQVYGYTNPLVLVCSAELDKLVYLFMQNYSSQKIKLKK